MCRVAIGDAGFVPSPYSPLTAIILANFPRRLQKRATPAAKTKAAATPRG